MTTVNHDPRRTLLVIYEDAPTERDILIDGITTDEGLRKLYTNIVNMHTDAWVLHRAGLLPEWWRLVREVRAEHLSKGKDLVTWPMGDAAVRIMGLTTAEITYQVQGWRVQRLPRPGEGRILRGRANGRPVRVTETRTTGTVRMGPPDTMIRHPEAFTADPAHATLRGVDDIEIDVGRVRIHVVGPYDLLPQRSPS